MSDSVARDPTQPSDSPSPPVAEWREPAAWVAGLLCFLLGVSEVSPRALIEQCAIPAGFLLTIGLGGMFLVLSNHLLAARSATPVTGYLRCNLELIPASLLFLVPIVSRFDETWRRLAPFAPAHPSSAPSDDPGGELNVLVRLVLYYAVWLGLAYCYASRSEPGIPGTRYRFSTNCLRIFSGPALLLLVFTLLLFSIDWVMGLEQGWRSPGAALYLFAGAVSAAQALRALFMLTRARLTAANLELRHDVAMLLFGFILLWAYVGYAQYLLVRHGYASAELVFYDRRAAPPWRWLTAALVVTHFVLPSISLLAVRAKRSAAGLLVASLCVLVGHWLDWCWLVLPALYPRGAALGATGLAVIVVTSLALGAVMITGLVRELQLDPAEPAAATAGE